MSMKDLQDKCTAYARVTSILNSLAGPNGQLRTSVAKGQGIPINGYRIGGVTMRDGRSFADHMLEIIDEAAECHMERYNALLASVEVADKVVAGLMPAED